MEFTIHTESYDPNVPLESEVRQMESILYSDIPVEIRSKYVELEKQWTLQREEAIGDSEDSATAKTPGQLIPFETEFYTPAFGQPDTTIPVGINSHTAVALSNMGVTKKHLQLVELEQYHLAWKFYLKRCRYKGQYNEKLKMLMGNPDQNLKVIVEMIVRDEELLQFKNSLPDHIEDEGGLNNDMAEREDSPYNSYSRMGSQDPISVERKSTDETYAFYFQSYGSGPKKNHWKCSNHVFSSMAPPGHALCEKFLLYAFYDTEDSIVVRLCQFKQKKPLLEWRIDGLKSKEKEELKAMIEDPTRILNQLPLLRCAVNSTGWMAVTNGITVWQRFLESPIIYCHSIERQVVSTLHIDEYGYLFLGTTNGQVYDISPFKYRSYSKDRETLAVLNIATSGGKKMCAMTINGILVPGGKVETGTDTIFPAKQLIVMRPITCAIRGTLVLFLSKFGVLIIRSVVHEYVNIDLLPLKGMQTNIDHVTPWYDRGIHFDGKKLAVMYPNGSVLVRVISEK